MCSLKKRSALAMGSGASSRFAQRLHGGAGHHGLAHLSRGVTRAHDMAGEQARGGGPGHRQLGKVLKEKCRSSISASTSPINWSGETLIGSWMSPCTWYFDAADFRELLALGHVVMDEPEAAIQAPWRWPCAIR